MRGGRYDVQGIVHIRECGARLGEICLGHAQGEVVGVIFVEIKDLVEGIEVNHALLVYLMNEGSAKGEYREQTIGKRRTDVFGFIVCIRF